MTTNGTSGSMNVIIRQAEKADAAAIQAIYAQPHAIHGTLQLPFPSVEMWEQRHAQADAGYHNLLAVLAEGRVVGQLGLQTISRPRRKHVASFGLAVCASVLGRGVATQLVAAAVDLCDNWLNIERLELEVYTDNIAAIGLYEKFGFVKEGEHQAFAFRDGAYVNTYTMARIRAWQGQESYVE